MKSLHPLNLLAVYLMLPRSDPQAFTPITRKSLSSISTLTAVSGRIIEIRNSNYRELFHGDKPILIDACAQWCGPCKLIEPVLERCAEQWRDTVTLVKFDVGCTHSNDIKVELLLKGVMPRSLPSLILIHKNKVLTTWKGVITDDQLNGMLEEHLATQQLEDTAMSQKGIPKVAVMASKEPLVQRKAGYVSFAMSASGDDYMMKHV